MVEYVGGVVMGRDVVAIIFRLVDGMIGTVTVEWVASGAVVRDWDGT